MRLFSRIALLGAGALLALAGLPPVTSAEVLVEDAAGTGRRQAFDAAQTTLSLSHVIELGGKREGRVAVAEAERARLRTERAARQLDVAAEVAQQFVTSLHERELLRIAEDDLRISDLFAMENIAPLDELLKHIDSSPDFMRFVDDARLRDAQVRLAELKRQPDVRTQIRISPA